MKRHVSFFTLNLESITIKSNVVDFRFGEREREHEHEPLESKFEVAKRKPTENGVSQ